MKLLEFRVEGFRCLLNINWVPLKKLSVFTGQNDGGKTSALDVLELFLTPKKRPEQFDYALLTETERCKKIVIEGVFELSSKEQKDLAYGQKIHIKAEYSENEKTKYSYKTKVHSDDRFNQDFMSMLKKDLFELVAISGISISKQANKDVIADKLNEWLGKQVLLDGFRGLPSEFFAKFPSIKIFRSSKTLSPIHEVNQTLNASFSKRIKADKYSGTLSTISTEIEKEMRTDLQDFEKKVQAYCPDVAEIEIEPTIDFSQGFRTSILKLKKSDGLPINLENEGEGRKRKITLAVYEWREKILTETNNEEQFIIAFDEPDTHLDYVAQRTILDIIKRISSVETNSVVVCTHSLNLIDRIPITDIVHFKKNETETDIETLETNDEPELIDMFLYGISDCMGLKNSIMLNEKCFLIVEGETEFFALPIIFKKFKNFSLQAGGIRLLNGGGCGGVRTLAKFLNRNRRNVLFLLDRDTLNNEKSVFHPNKLAEDGFDVPNQVFFVGKIEFEDAFSDKIYLETAKKNWKKFDQSEWTEGEFTPLRQHADYSGKLLTLLRQQTKSQITKPDIGRCVAKTIDTPDDIPPEIVRCLNRAFTIANNQPFL